MTGDKALAATKNAALETALAAAKSGREEQKTAAQFELPDMMDWKQWRLPVTAALLARIPQKGGRDGDYFLTREEAAVWAIVSYEMNLSPFTGDTYFMRGSNRVNVTLQGKLKRARQEGFNLGAPKFERLPADITKPCVGYKCILPVSNGKQSGQVEYAAMLTEWMMPSNPNWKTRTEHMLQVRAFEKAVSFASGVGVSENPDERDIETAATEAIDIPATAVEYIPPAESK